MYSEEYLRSAHKHSIRNRGELERSVVCGCFYCKSIFQYRKIKYWLPETRCPDISIASPYSQITAWCPNCGIDAVIGDASGFAPTRLFLAAMRYYFFW